MKPHLLISSYAADHPEAPRNWQEAIEDLRFKVAWNLAGLTRRVLKRISARVDDAHLQRAGLDVDALRTSEPRG